MRLRSEGSLPVKFSNEATIRKVLKVDRFNVKYFKLANNTVYIGVINTKFRSQAQAVGRIASTLQRFTSDEIKFANIHFQSHDILIASYRVDLDDITFEQFNPTAQ